jgi:hypothetical protein
MALPPDALMTMGARIMIASDCSMMGQETDSSALTVLLIFRFRSISAAQIEIRDTNGTNALSLIDCLYLYDRM